MLGSIDKKVLLRLSFGLVVMGALLLGLPLPKYGDLVLALAAYIVVAYQVVYSAFVTLFKRLCMNEQFLMTAATFGAFMLHDYPEALAVMIFYQIGELFEDYASGRAHHEITTLVKLKPSSVRVIDEVGNENIKKPRQVKIGQRMRVLAGEAVAIDGRLLSKDALMDMSALTGESYPQKFNQGEEIPSGAINLGQVIDLQSTCESKNSSITRLINLIEDAAANKSRPEALITRFAVYYTPIVVTFAVLMAFAPFVFDGLDKSDYVTRALVFLVVSCPCALVLSVPLSFFGGLGAISKIGVMVKGSIFIENLAKLKQLCFDKTGTITRGVFALSEIKAESSVQADELCAAMAALEQGSTHPIAKAISSYAVDHKLSIPAVTEIKEEAGFGLQGLIDGKLCAAGRRQYIEKLTGHEVPHVSGDGTAVYCALNGEYAGVLFLRDEEKPEAAEMMNALSQMGIKTCLLTGDRKSEAELIARRLNITEVHSQLLPQDKLEILTKFKRSGQMVGFVGDGINDAPVLSAADVGIAMGKGGSALAVESSDVVVMNDDLTKIPRAIELSRRTMVLAMQNMIFVIGVKAAILVLGAMGIANIWLAILGDVGLCVLAVVNAMRTLTFVKEPKAVQTEGSKLEAKA